MGTTGFESTTAQASRSEPNPASTSACPWDESVKIFLMLSPYFLSISSAAQEASFSSSENPGFLMDRTYRPAQAASSRLKCPSLPAQTIEISVEREAALSIAETAER